MWDLGWVPVSLPKAWVLGWALALAQKNVRVLVLRVSEINLR